MGQVTNETNNQNIVIGLPTELGLKPSEYLPKLRNLYNSNSRGLLERLSDQELANGVLRRIPFFRFFDTVVQYQPEALHIAQDTSNGIVGFLGSPVVLPLKIFNLYIQRRMKKEEIDKIPGLRQAMEDTSTQVYINTTLCVDKNYRKQGIAKALKTRAEERLKKKHSQLSPGQSPKIILLTMHETNNNASSTTHDSLGYHKLFDYKFPWPFKLSFTARVKVI